MTSTTVGDARFEGEAVLAAACSRRMPWLSARLSRLDVGARLALLAASQAIEGAEESGVQVRNATNVLLWYAVEGGSAEVDRAFWATASAAGGAFASPALFAGTLPSAAAAEVASGFGLLGPCMVVTGRAASPQLPPPGVARAFGAEFVLAVEASPDRARATLFPAGDPAGPA